MFLLLLDVSMFARFSAPLPNLKGSCSQRKLMLTMCLEVLDGITVSVNRIANGI